jgi:hypothetical protein
MHASVHYIQGGQGDFKKEYLKTTDIVSNKKNKLMFIGSCNKVGRALLNLTLLDTVQTLSNSLI